MRLSWNHGEITCKSWKLEYTVNRYLLTTTGGMKFYECIRIIGR